MQVEVINTRKVTRKLEQMERQLYPAVLRVLNRTLKRARTVAAKDLRTQLGLPSAIIKKDLVADRASKQRLEAKLVAKKPSPKGNGLPLHRFNARPLRGGKGGVSFATGTPAGRKKLEGAFFMSPKGGGQIIAIRKFKSTAGVARVSNAPASKRGSGRKGGKKGLQFPVGPSIDQAYPVVRRKARREARKFMSRDLQREIKYRTEKIWTR
ncbi:phage tail protein [Spectribacter hydrogenoxidans]|uniref:Phage tail protein n=1 Tax=Spectribacter hydrogenoxidans TaxID=3075608 RepID=A0ABU3C0L3_9GAMM|nr:phage tail protein [Salinisphaera sp. W335]MDT0635098.1 phage tail protein [Salinisphaera sp. W335]